MAAGHSAGKKCEGSKSDMPSMLKFVAETLITKRSTDSDGNEQLWVDGVASSTVRDKQGDTIRRSALEKMARTAIGKTVFMGHNYDPPNNVFGVIHKARIVKTGEVDPKTGEPIHDLRFGIGVADQNPEAVKTFNLMDRNKVKLGISIGADLPESGAWSFDTSKGGRYVLDDIEFGEASVVGLPAQQRALIDHAVRAIAGNWPEKAADHRMALIKKLTKEDKGPSEGPADLVDDHGGEQKVEVPEHVQEATDLEDAAKDAAEDSGINKSTEPEVIADYEDLDVEKKATLFAGDEGTPVVLEPTETITSAAALTKTKVTVWDGDKTVEVDTGRSKPKAQSAQDDDPDSAGGDQSGMAKDDEPQLVKSLTGQVHDLQKQLTDLAKERDEALAERDAAIKLAENAHEQARTLIKQIESMPMGRKTQFAEIKEQFSDLEAIYDPAVLKLLRKPEVATR